VWDACNSARHSRSGTGTGTISPAKPVIVLDRFEATKTSSKQIYVCLSRYVVHLPGYSLFVRGRGGKIARAPRCVACRRSCLAWVRASGSERIDDAQLATNAVAASVGLSISPAHRFTTHLASVNCATGHDIHSCCTRTLLRSGAMGCGMPSKEAASLNHFYGDESHHCCSVLDTTIWRARDIKPGEKHQTTFVSEVASPHLHSQTMPAPVEDDCATPVAFKPKFLSSPKIEDDNAAGLEREVVSLRHNQKDLRGRQLSTLSLCRHSSGASIIFASTLERSRRRSAGLHSEIASKLPSTLKSYDSTSNLPQEEPDGISPECGADSTSSGWSSSYISPGGMRFDSALITFSQNLPSQTSGTECLPVNLAQIRVVVDSSTSATSNKLVSRSIALSRPPMIVVVHASSQSSVPGASSEPRSVGSRRMTRTSASELVVVTTENRARQTREPLGLVASGDGEAVHMHIEEPRQLLIHTGKDRSAFVVGFDALKRVSHCSRHRQEGEAEAVPAVTSVHPPLETDQAAEVPRQQYRLAQPVEALHYAELRLELLKYDIVPLLDEDQYRQLYPMYQTTEPAYVEYCEKWTQYREQLKQEECSGHSRSIYSSESYTRAPEVAASPQRLAPPTRR
jgi:hypothetical protein